MRRAIGVFGALLVGCVAVRPTVPTAEIVVYPKIVPHSQAILLPNTLSSIATLDILPYVEVSEGVYSPISALTGNPTAPEDPNLLKLTQASPTIDPNRPFVIRKLKPNKRYRVVGQAYNASNVLISKNDTSYVGVDVGSNDAPLMATLPINLTDITFGANAVVTLNTDGRYDSLKSTLYLVAGNSQISWSQTSRLYPTLSFTNLQANTSYKLVAEAYKFGGMVASESLTLAIANDTTPATATLTLSIPYVTSTLAGSGSAGATDGMGVNASFNSPRGCAVDALGNIYVADTVGNRIRKVTPGGQVTTLAGNGDTAFADGLGTSATFYSPRGVAVDSAGNVYVADSAHNRIRKIDTSRNVTTVAGNDTAGTADGTGTSAFFNYPKGVVLDAFGNLFVLDSNNHRIRKIDPNKVVTTFAGSGSPGTADGTGAAASFNTPFALTMDAWGNLFVADEINHRIRKVTPGGGVSTFAGNGATAITDGTGTSATFHNPAGIAIDLQGNLYVADYYDNRIRKISPTGVVRTIAGTDALGTADGTGIAATFTNPCGIAVDSQGNLYVGDSSSHKLRKLQ